MDPQATEVERVGHRRSKLTPEVQERVLTAIRAGNYVETAARYAGVHPSTVWRWWAEGADEDADEAKRGFREAVERARAEAEARMVAATVKDAMGGVVVRRVTRTLPGGAVETDEQFTPPNGRVALDYLGRTNPARWARRSGVELSGPEGGPIQVQQTRLIQSLAERLHVELNQGAESSDDAEEAPGSWE